MNIQIEKIKNLIIEGELDDALNLLNEGANNTSFENDSTLLFSRFNKLKKEKNNNIISEDLEQLEYNKITIATLNLLDTITNSFFYDDVIYENLMFFETPKENIVPKDNREYFTEFETEKVRHVGWELYMRYPPVLHSFNYTIKWQVIKPNNKVMPKVTNEFTLHSGWSNSWIAASWGSENYGTWEKGKSTIKIYIGEKLISEGDFLIL